MITSGTTSRSLSAGSCWMTEAIEMPCRPNTPVISDMTPGRSSTWKAHVKAAGHPIVIAGRNQGLAL